MSASGVVQRSQTTVSSAVWLYACAANASRSTRYGLSRERVSLM
jgi:hypothetical protein